MRPGSSSTSRATSLSPREVLPRAVDPKSGTTPNLHGLPTPNRVSRSPSYLVPPLSHHQRSSCRVRLCVPYRFPIRRHCRIFRGGRLHNRAEPLSHRMISTQPREFRVNIAFPEDNFVACQCPMAQSGAIRAAAQDYFLSPDPTVLFQTGAKKPSMGRTPGDVQPFPILGRQRFDARGNTQGWSSRQRKLPDMVLVGSREVKRLAVARPRRASVLDKRLQ